MTLDDVQRVDRDGMYRLIREFPRQVEEAIAIGRRADLPRRRGTVKNIVISGMGGSAIAGDVLRCLLVDQLPMPVTVNRDYVLPGFVGPGSLVVISSYSGTTEETISAYAAASKRKAQVICISSNGDIESTARRRKDVFIRIPGGLSPRAALGYLFFPLLIVLSRMSIVTVRRRDLGETVKLLSALSDEYSDPALPSNFPAEIASRLHGKLVIVYSPLRHLEAVNLRWRGQLCENAKHMAVGNFLPEMNHNEIVGWGHPSMNGDGIAVVMLRDSGDHPRIARREEVTRDILKPRAGAMIEIQSRGSSMMARMFSLIYLADWTSLYLAILNSVDPTPIDVINRLKTELSKM